MLTHFCVLVQSGSCDTPPPPPAVGPSGGKYDPALGVRKGEVEELGMPFFLLLPLPLRFFLGLLTRRALGAASGLSTMFLRVLLLGALFCRTQGYFSEERSSEESKMQPPTVVIAILARNSAHSLPYYLGALERLNYPKDRISVWWVLLRPLF